MVAGQVANRCLPLPAVGRGSDKADGSPLSSLLIRGVPRGPHIIRNGLGQGRLTSRQSLPGPAVGRGPRHRIRTSMAGQGRPTSRWPPGPALGRGPRHQLRLIMAGQGRLANRWPPLPVAVAGQVANRWPPGPALGRGPRHQLRLVVAGQGRPTNRWPPGPAVGRGPDKADGSPLTLARLLR